MTKSLEEIMALRRNKWRCFPACGTCEICRAPTDVHHQNEEDAELDRQIVEWLASLGEKAK